MRLIPKEKAEQIVIHDVDFEMLFDIAWSAYVPFLKHGYAVLNLVDGTIEPLSLGTGELPSGRDAYHVKLFKIDKDTVIEPEMILSEEELAEYKQVANKIDLQEWVEQKGMNYYDLIKEYFWYCYDNCSINSDAVFYELSLHYQQEN